MRPTHTHGAAAVTDWVCGSNYGGGIGCRFFNHGAISEADFTRPQPSRGHITRAPAFFRL